MDPRILHQQFPFVLSLVEGLLATAHHGRTDGFWSCHEYGVYN